MIQPGREEAMQYGFFWRSSTTIGMSHMDEKPLRCSPASSSEVFDVLRTENLGLVIETFKLKSEAANARSETHRLRSELDEAKRSIDALTKKLSERVRGSLSQKGTFHCTIE